MSSKKIFFHSESLPEIGNKCLYDKDRVNIQKIKKVGCPYVITREEAEMFFKDICKQYPESLYCKKPEKSLPDVDTNKIKPKMGMIVDDKGNGVGIVTTKGEVKKLPSIVPRPLPQVADKAGTVPIVKSIEEGDSDDLASQVKLGREVNPIPTPPPLPDNNFIPTPPPLKYQIIPETTKKQDKDLLEDIRKGIQLQSKNKQQKCDMGFYWSQKLGKCIAVKKEEGNDLISALRNKFKNVPSGEYIEVIEEEWN